MDSWLAENALNVVQTLAILVALVLSILEFRKTRLSDAVVLEHEITKSHRELFLHLLSDPDLIRVLEPTVQINSGAPSIKEKQYISLLFLHIYSAFQANKAGLLVTSETDRKSIAEFFSLPLPRSVWKETKDSYRSEFVTFVDEIVDEQLIRTQNHGESANRDTQVGRA